MSPDTALAPQRMGLRPQLRQIPVCGNQVLSFKNLCIKAPIGILAHEQEAPQAIRVDVELNQGLQPLQPGSHIQHVLDYRVVRQMVLDECTAQHVNLLESLVGQLAVRLSQLPSILGVRVKVAKLHIFPDCEVAIQVEVGNWHAPKLA